MNDEIKKLRFYLSQQNETISQILGKALGFPWLKDDPKNFPDATEEDGVCVGYFLAEDLAIMAAERINELETLLHDFENIHR